MSGWVMVLRFPSDAPEGEIVHAAKAVKDMLAPSFGRVTSTTVREDMYEAFLRPVPPFAERHSDIGRPEHQGSTSTNGHRKRPR